MNPLNGVFDLLLAPFGRHTDLALTTISVLLGVAAMFIFRATSDQGAVRRIRNRVLAHVLEMRIYQDDLALILRALGATLASNLRYLGVVGGPILLIALLMAIAFIQLDARFARAPVSAHEAALVTVTYGSEIDVMGADARLEAGPGAMIDSIRVRVPARQEVTWRVWPDRSGTPRVTVHAGSGAYRFPLAAEPGTGLKGSERSRTTLWESFLHPGLPHFGSDLWIERVAVSYPTARHWLFGWRAHWLVVFIVWSLVGALIPKLILRIEI